MLGRNNESPPRYSITGTFLVSFWDKLTAKLIFSLITLCVSHGRQSEPDHGGGGGTHVVFIGPPPASKVAQVLKKLMSGGGGHSAGDLT